MGVMGIFLFLRRGVVSDETSQELGHKVIELSSDARMFMARWRCSPGLAVGFGVALLAGAPWAFAQGAPAQTYVFVCPDKAEYVVRTTGAEAWLLQPGGTRRLPALAGAAGSAYSDGRFELRIEDGQAQLGPAASRGQVCQNDERRAIWEKAKLDGADFRAIGSDPDWVLEIQRQSRVVLVTDRGAQPVELPLPVPREDQDARTTRWQAGELQIEAIARGCRDRASGEAFEAEVIVIWQGRTLRGCGRALH